MPNFTLNNQMFYVSWSEVLLEADSDERFHIGRALDSLNELNKLGTEIVHRMIREDKIDLTANQGE
ncbi:hypothetical protein LCGC14_0650300 [marine sediment metagenome]|uniref:Uncharacterized protein n=1 Tax=marine sediment metagenome TaxID=412755 RepID=A0A0F9TIB2_9ZZZZ|nr:hypothetical protein [Candidatus Aminicenantes bacterium]